MISPDWLPEADRPGSTGGRIEAEGGPPDDPPAGARSDGTAFELNGTFLGGYGEPGPGLAGGRSLQADGAAELGAHLVDRKLELIVDPSSPLLPFYFLRTGDRLGRAVVKLLRGDGASGTGFLVAPGILLTNHHVLPDRATAASTIVLANYEVAAPGTPPGRPASVPLDPDDLFVVNAELDFTFCGVRGLDFLGSIGLARSSRTIAESETVNIIQHPRGRPKEVALRDNRVVKADRVVVQYECSTEPGSSGSPVFNNEWEPVALHHASVLARGAEGVDGGAGPARYLNEGIRISAIALWLETVDAGGADPRAREQVARLRAIFEGIDPGVGFFGALGRKSSGKLAPRVVVESYGDDTDDLDLAFWNVRGMELGSREQVAEVARVVADLGMDLWCLAHADPDYARALRDLLESHHGRDFGLFHEPAGEHPALALLHRRSKSLTVERRGWGVELPEGVSLPPLLTVRASTRRVGPVAFQLVPVGRPGPSEAAWPPFAEAVRHAIRRGLGEFDWIIVGDSPVLLAPERLQVLADCDRELIAAAAERDGVLALLTAPRSKVARVFASPNLRPAFGLPETLSIATDRGLPARLETLGGHRPIALRLAFDGPRPGPTPVDPTPLPPSFGPRDLTPADGDLERRIRDMIAPVLAKLLADAGLGTGEGG